MKRGFKTWAEEISLRYRRALGLKSDDDLPARVLAQHIAEQLHSRIIVAAPADVPGIQNHVVESLGLNSGFSAVVVPVDHTLLVIHNPSHSAPRQESDLMHEIAHLICQHPPDRIVMPLMMRTHTDEQEEEAKFLGGCLQVPRSGLINHLRQGRTIPEIADIYGASKDLVTYRVGITGAKLQLDRYLAGRSHYNRRGGFSI